MKWKIQTTIKVIIIRIKILRDYKQQIVLYLQKKLNKIGLQAFNSNLTDIFEITL